MGIYTEEKYLTIQPMELVTNEGLTIGLPPNLPSLVRGNKLPRKTQK